MKREKKRRFTPGENDDKDKQETSMYRMRVVCDIKNGNPYP